MHIYDIFVKTFEYNKFVKIVNFFLGETKSIL